MAETDQADQKMPTNMYVYVFVYVGMAFTWNLFFPAATPGCIYAKN